MLKTTQEHLTEEQLQQWEDALKEMTSFIKERHNHVITSDVDWQKLIEQTKHPQAKDFYTFCEQAAVRKAKRKPPFRKRLTVF